MLVNVNIPVETIFLLGLAVLVVQMFQRQSHLMAGRQGCRRRTISIKLHG